MGRSDSHPRALPHAPVLGLTHRLLGRFHVTGVFWYRFAYWAFTALPPWTEWVSVSVFATFFFLTLGRIRGALAANLEPVLGPAGRLERLGRAYRTLWAFAWCLTERYRRLANPELFRATLEGAEHWREVTDGSGGLLLVTAHVGPWETAAHFGQSNSPRRIHIVREKEIDPRAQQFIEQLLARSGNQFVTHFAGEDLTLAVELAHALREGDVVALQSDRPRAGSRTVTVDLFGRPMPLPSGPAALARATGVPILPVFNFRDGRFRVRTVVRPPIRVRHTSDRDADVADAMHQMAREIERAIRHRPHQWFCFRDLWGSREVAHVVQSYS
jgi:phosphatidylinositol dimannoside acyltransferase